MKHLYLLMLAVSISVASMAQYEFSTFTAAYASFNDGTVVDDGGPWDDPFFTVPFGFDFTAGELSTNNMTQDGFGSAFLLGTFNSGAYLGYLEDLADGANVNGAAQSIISYKTEGTAGNRICKVQYDNCAFYYEVFNAGESSAENRISFQIWIYEADYSVEFRFGPNNITNPGLVYELSTGPQIGIFTGLANGGETFQYGSVLDGDPTNPTVNNSTDLSELQFVGLDGTPENGRVYRFSPDPLSTDENAPVDFTLYPSPADDFIQIRGEIVEGTKYQIVDATGRLVLSGNYRSNSKIDVKDLNTGIYLLQLESGTTRRFVKK